MVQIYCWNAYVELMLQVLKSAFFILVQCVHSVTGYFSQISTLADVQENVMRYLHVMSRPKVIDHEHDTVWTEAYVDSAVSMLQCLLEATSRLLFHTAVYYKFDSLTVKHYKRVMFYSLDSDSCCFCPALRAVVKCLYCTVRVPVCGYALSSLFFMLLEWYLIMSFINLHGSSPVYCTSVSTKSMLSVQTLIHW